MHAPDNSFIENSEAHGYEFVGLFPEHYCVILSAIIYLWLITLTASKDYSSDFETT